MIVPLIVVGVLVAWVPIGALVFRGFTVMERLDPPRRYAAYVFTSHDTYTETCFSDPVNFGVTLVAWPLALLGVSCRYAMRGLRWVGFAWRSSGNPLVIVSDGVKLIAGVPRKRYFREIGR